MRNLISFFAIITLALFAVPACNNSGDSKKTEGMDTADVEGISLDTTSTSVNCVTLSRAQLQNWANAGWTRPGGSNEVIWMKFTTNYTGSTSDLDVTAWGTKSDTIPITNSAEQLQTGTNCSTTMPAGMSYGPNFFKLTDLGVINADGSLKSFDYIRLTPQTSSEPNVARYGVEVVDRGTATSKGSTNPCPPPVLCPPF